MTDGAAGGTAKGTAGGTAGGTAKGTAPWTWELRNPDGGMLGLEFARAVTDPTEVMLAHALPERLDITVRDRDTDEVVARGHGLSGGESSPIARLHVSGGEVTRENVWPDESDYGRPVVLPGGEVGILLEWWNADDKRAWRWKVEFSNSLD